jgi:Spy/CpxP family protein refolding chaperone
MGGLTAGAVAVKAAETSAAIATGETPGMWKTLISGQIGRLLALRSDLDLTSEQKDQIKEILQSHRTEIAAAIKPVVEKRRALGDTVMADPIDEQAIRTAAGNLSNSIGDAAVLAAKVRTEVSKVLTPEQRATVAAFRKDSEHAVDQFLDKLGKP